MNDKIKDLGLPYEVAMHGVQTAIANEIERGNTFATPKHLRVGVDGSKADMFGLVCLLIDKGIITEDEYVEYMRLGANTELANWEEKYSEQAGLDVKFR